jgi:ribosomal protein S18 acetylase RimI-like enzyme
MTARQPLFCDARLAERIERAEAGRMAAASEAARRRGAQPAGFVMPVAGGMATFAGAGSPFNKVAGLGFGGMPSQAELAEVERAFAAHGSAVRAELSNLADPAVAAMLTGRGYRLVSFENVLGRPPGGPGGDEGGRPPAGIDVRRARAGEFELWLGVVLDGFAQADDEGVRSHEEFPREVVALAQRDFANAGALLYIALRDGVIAGGAGLALTGAIAHMAGAATAPAHRRRGIQTALLAARLADAAAAGCDVAVVTTQPGSVSQRNVQRQGFDLLYTRAVLVRPSSGLD